MLSQKLHEKNEQKIFTGEKRLYIMNIRRRGAHKRYFRTDWDPTSVCLWKN